MSLTPSSLLRPRPPSLLVLLGNVIHGPQQLTHFVCVLLFCFKTCAKCSPCGNLIKIKAQPTSVTSAASYVKPLFLPLALPLPLLLLLLPLDTRGAISVECARAACIKFSLFTWKKTLNEENWNKILTKWEIKVDGCRGRQRNGERGAESGSR